MKPNQKIDPRINSVVCGDCLEWLQDIPPESIDLCYIDPPFFSNKSREIIWGNGYELRSFDDRWKGGINAYIEWMEERVKMIHRCLKDTGSIFLHCDWHASHRLRVMLDEVFGADNFINEIIWLYRTGGGTKRRFGRKHDNIFWFSKDSKKYFYKCIKERIYYEKPFFNPKQDKDGRYYADVLPDDTWDIKAVLNVSSERIGYRTQKPEKLLERVIQCSTKEGDVVLDCFGGGGTTAAVAAKLDRRFIVGDVSPVAVRVTSKRLRDLPDPPVFDVLNVPRTIDEWLAMNGHKFAEEICNYMGWVCNPKKSGDGGIDGWANNRTVPIQIKKSKAVGINPIKNFFASLGKALEGIFVAHSFAKTAEEFRAQIKRDEDKDIKLISIEEILEDILIDDCEKNKLDELYRKYDKAA